MPLTTFSVQLMAWSSSDNILQQHGTTGQLRMAANPECITLIHLWNATQFKPYNNEEDPRDSSIDKSDLLHAQLQSRFTKCEQLFHLHQISWFKSDVMSWHPVQVTPCISKMNS